MTFFHYAGMILVLGLITVTGFYSGMRVKEAKDFATGGNKGGTGLVVGTITGTLIGGASTIGTAQLAVLNGFSAWWFTLGAGLGCIILALAFAGPLYQREGATLSGIFADEYGKKVGFISTILMSIGSLLSIVAQILSGVGLVLSAINIDPGIASLGITLLMLVYVVFGGVWGTGMVGIVKLILLSASIILCGVLALNMAGGPLTFYNQLPREAYFDLVARGAGIDLGGGLSLIVGVLSTQTYIQAVLSARSLKEAKKGAIISGLLIPPMGILCIFVGMYVKLFHQEWNALSALPGFAMTYLPPVLAGAALATLLVTLVGTGAGMALGISSMFVRDVYKAYIKPGASDKTMLRVSRGGIVVVLGLALFLTTGGLGSMILDWSFLAMGLRGAVAIAPLCFVLFFPGKIKGFYAGLAMAAGPLFVLIGKFFLPKGLDPLFYGIAAAVLVMAAGYGSKKG